MIRLATPAALLLLIPAALVAWRVFRRGTRRGLVFSGVPLLPGAAATWRTRAAALLPFVTFAGLVLSVVALARPQSVLSRLHRSIDAIAIQMVVDASGSMEALDMSQKTAAGVKLQTRLDVVKEEFKRFVEKRPDDLIGLVTFGGYASTRCPLTSDHDALEHILDGVEVPKQAFDANGAIVNQEEMLTAIGDALATALARLEKVKPKSRVIVLLSDGESNTGIVQPPEAAAAAKKMKVRVYSIGVGSNGQAPFRVRDMFGRETVQYAGVTLNEEQLKEIAQVTGGRYYNVRDPKGLAAAMEEINTLEKTKVEEDTYNQYREFFPWFLVPGMALVVLGTSLTMAVARRVI